MLVVPLCSKVVDLTRPGIGIADDFAFVQSDLSSAPNQTWLPIADQFCTTCRERKERMFTLKHTRARTIVGTTTAALAVMIGIVAAPGAASAAESPHPESTDASSALIEGPLIDLGDLMNLIGSINIGQFQ